MDKDQFVVDKIKAAIPEAIEEVADFRGERTITVQKDQLTAVCQLLRDNPLLQYNFLSDICADDMLPDFPRFAVNYHLYSIPQNHRLRLRVWVEDPDEGPKTMGSIWPIASWLETEVYDLMGIKFEDHTNLRRLFLPEDWQGHPLRKDYPLGYEEVQFSFNWQEIDAKKPYAKK
ncbi:MAG: NADH-quinone oxidoreductase subunit C [Anaerolineales bacterium]|nr:NADH-quinone oxidoreductase subunit C [Anaerolineales bacterium]MCA9927621.1 NADH-quinone oxidoreductase subunit C [Anaerolineales bacterium]